jgi:3-hydroxyisobutyrate dehydrogenase-like beta-hydroxyacid dehydrogenase
VTLTLLSSGSYSEHVPSSRPPCRMFVNRVSHMLDNDYTPKSALDIFVKDLVSLFSAASPRWAVCAFMSLGSPN